MDFYSSVNSSLPDNNAVTLSEGWRNDGPAIIVGEEGADSTVENSIAHIENLTDDPLSNVHRTRLNASLPDNQAATLSGGWRNDGKSTIVVEAEATKIGENVIAETQHPTDDLTPHIQHSSVNSSLPDNYAATLSDGWRNDDPAMIVDEEETANIQGNVIVDTHNPTEEPTPIVRRTLLNSTLPDNYAVTLSEGWRHDAPAIIVEEEETVSMGEKVIADTQNHTEIPKPNLQHSNVNPSLSQRLCPMVGRNDDPVIIVGEDEVVSIGCNVIVDTHSPTDVRTPESALNTTLPDNYAATLSEGWRNDDPAIIVGEGESVSIQGNVIIDSQTDDLTPHLKHSRVYSSVPDNYAATLSDGWRNDDPAIIVDEEEAASIQGNVIVADPHNPTDDLTPHFQHSSVNSSLPDNYAATLSEGWRNDDPAIIVEEAEDSSMGEKVIADTQYPTDELTSRLQQSSVNSSLPDNYAATLSEGWRNDEPAILVEEEAASFVERAIIDTEKPTYNVSPFLLHSSVNSSLTGNQAVTLSDGWRNDDKATIVEEKEADSIQENFIADTQHPTDDPTPALGHSSVTSSLPDNYAATLSEGWRNDDPAIIVGEEEDVSIGGKVIADTENPSEHLTLNVHRTRLNASLLDNEASTLSDGWRNDGKSTIVEEADSVSIRDNVIIDTRNPTEDLTPDLQFSSVTSSLPDNYAATLSEGWRNDDPAIIAGENEVVSIGGNAIVDTHNPTVEPTPNVHRTRLNASLPDNEAATLSNGWRNDGKATIVEEAVAVSMGEKVIANTHHRTDELTPDLQHSSVTSSLPDNYAATLSDGWRNDDPAIIVGEDGAVSIGGNVIVDTHSPTDVRTPESALNTTLPDNYAATLSEGWRNDDPTIIVGEDGVVRMGDNDIADTQNPSTDVTHSDDDTDPIIQEKQLPQGQPGQLEGMEDWMARHGGQRHADDEAYLEAAKATAATTVEKKDDTRRTVAASDVDAEIKYGDRDEIDFRGGHNNEFVVELPDYNCHFCEMPRRDPVQVKGCGHSYCKSCWVYWHRLMHKVNPHEDYGLVFVAIFRTKMLADRDTSDLWPGYINGDETTSTCIMCDTVVKLANVFVDVNQDRIIRSQKVYCPNKGEGCDVMIALWDVNESHIPRCAYQTMQCDLGCGETMLRDDLARHVADECPHRLLNCELCDAEVKSSLMQLLETHHEECPDFPTYCSLAPLGCTERIVRSELPTHHQLNSLQHLALMKSAVHLFIGSEESTEGQAQGLLAQYELPRPLWGSVGKVDILATKRQMDDLQDANARLTLDVGELNETIVQVRSENRRVMEIVCRNQKGEMARLREEIKKGDVVAKSGEVQDSSCTEGSETSDSEQSGDESEVQDSPSSNCSDAEEVVDDILDSMLIPAVEIEDVERPICPCYWRLRLDHLMNVESPPFYTTAGYKMRLLVWCSSEWLDVRCCLIQGERDDELSWPWVGNETMAVREVRNRRKLVGKDCGVEDVGGLGRQRPREERYDRSLLYNLDIPHPGDLGFIDVTVI